MIVPKYARYEYCVYKAYDFLNRFSISNYPINAFNIIKHMKWGLVRYSDLAIEFCCSIDDIINTLGSEDGFTIYDDYNYTIAYNNLKKPKKRIAFTLFHEIGHIYLNHLNDFEATKLFRGSLTKEEIQVLENESNTFARNVLVPAIILKNMDDIAPDKISEQFGITVRAAKTRLDFLEKDLTLINWCGIENEAMNVYHRYKKIIDNSKKRKESRLINFSAIEGILGDKWGYYHL